jgi:hypothetical protein
MNKFRNLLDEKSSLDYRSVIVNRQNPLESRAINLGFNGIAFILGLAINSLNWAIDLKYEAGS